MHQYAQRQNLATKNRLSTLQGALDLRGLFCTSGSEREFTQEGRWYGHEEAQAGADCSVAAADRSGHLEWKDHPASLPGSGDHRADLLPLAEGIRRAEAGPGQAAQGP